ncbi:hypothetical protein BN1080_02845 [Planococcus massiliensis]|uniref:Uncharacterized protein n=1 Tax=Planococcus massiliensis TaxID=1499687 RepID=A0A098ENG9_9BACL|nr:hypothetical protein [Planococcus massiliensis]CEG23838.1 hypothetical protein BN1080_02845 [Planococcus massiliensis]
MDNLQWESFLQFWENGDYEKAASIPLEDKQLGGTGVINKLFRSPSIDSHTIAGISFLDVIYDYAMVDPSIIQAVDFARKEDLSNFFAFQIFAKELDLEQSGELIRLKGYAAERLIALELQGKGHEVSFPESSNQKGFDLLVDGQQFQVKCLSSVGGVHEHFRKYPDIPVLVNSELTEKLEANPLVFGTGVSNEVVDKATYSSLKHAAEFGDLNIPLIATGIATLKNGHNVLVNGLDLKTAGLNVANEVGARGVGGIAGKGVGLMIGPLLGPAGVVVLPIIFGIGGSYGGKKLTNSIKKIYTQKERQMALTALKVLIETILKIIPKKIELHEENFKKLNYEVSQNKILNNLSGLFDKKSKDKKKYLNNKENELREWLSKIDMNKLAIEKESLHVLDTIVKTQIHPSLYQVELTKFGDAYSALGKL